MKKKSVFKYLINCLHKAIYFFVFANLFIFLSFSESFSKEDIFSVNEIEIQGSLDQNFSRDKHLNKAFSESFKILMRKILLTRDLNKISNIKLNEIKNLINSFQIIEEKYSKDEYKVTLNILYDDEDIIIINKSPGIVVHPGAGNFENTIVNGLLFKYQNQLRTKSNRGTD